MSDAGAMEDEEATADAGAMEDEEATADAVATAGEAAMEATETTGAMEDEEATAGEGATLRSIHPDIHRKHRNSREQRSHCRDRSTRRTPPSVRCVLA
jgi:hypothetical protein